MFLLLLSLHYYALPYFILLVVVVIIIINSFSTRTDLVIYGQLQGVVIYAITVI